ncbi:MAG TPA: hypothetical protein VMQ67_11640 [Candidatus Saccharimonadales bacterium]|jgi:hypothetical protein|nr:hypothetical protein [Candidatus Saccharimonadales bacterium]
MNKTLNIGKLTLVTLATALGTFLWTGCASAPDQPAEQSGLETTIDASTIGPDTTPQYRHDFFSPFQTGWTVENIE